MHFLQHDCEIVRFFKIVCRLAYTRLHYPVYILGGFWGLTCPELSGGSSRRRPRRHRHRHQPFCTSVMLRPHAPGTFIRLWRPSRFDVDVHAEYIFEDGVTLRCKYCRWEAGMYHDRFYIRDHISGWWEEDPGICECIYFDRCDTLITTGTQFLVPGTLQVHTCDYPMNSFVKDADECLVHWSSVIAIASFRPMGAFGIPRWRRRMHDKAKDILGRCLSLRDWIRVRRCTVRLRDSCLMALLAVA